MVESLTLDQFENPEEIKGVFYYLVRLHRAIDLAESAFGQKGTFGK